jgi:hypothetical protein
MKVKIIPTINYQLLTNQPNTKHKTQNNKQITYQIQVNNILQNTNIIQNIKYVNAINILYNLFIRFSNRYDIYH